MNIETVPKVVHKSNSLFFVILSIVNQFFIYGLYIHPISILYPSNIDLPGILVCICNKNILLIKIAH